MPTITPTPIALVTGLSDDLRAAGIDALRAMTVNGPLLALSGNPETLVADLAAAPDAACTVIELDEIDEVGAVLDAIEPYLANERFVLLGIVTMLDARHFWTDFSGGEPDEVQQLIAQIEAASLVLLTGEAAMPAETLHRVEGFVWNLNPTAVVLPSASLAAQTLDTLAEAIDAAGNEDSIDVDPDDEAIAGETDAWGFNSFTWTTESLLDSVADFQSLLRSGQARSCVRTASCAWMTVASSWSRRSATLSPWTNMMSWTRMTGRNSAPRNPDSPLSASTCR